MLINWHRLPVDAGNDVRLSTAVAVTDEVGAVLDKVDISVGQEKDFIGNFHEYSGYLAGF